MSNEDGLEARIAQLEARLNWLYQRGGYGTPYPQQPIDENSVQISPTVHDLLSRGKKIGAIKQLRSETGLDLREAKRIVDRLG